MLSGILNSKRAVQVNIQIMRAFIQFRRFVLDNEALRRELEDLKQQTENRFQIVFETLDRLIAIGEDAGHPEIRRTNEIP